MMSSKMIMKNAAFADAITKASDKLQRQQRFNFVVRWTPAFAAVSMVDAAPLHRLIAGGTSVIASIALTKGFKKTLPGLRRLHPYADNMAKAIETDAVDRHRFIIEQFAPELASAGHDDPISRQWRKKHALLVQLTDDMNEKRGSGALQRHVKGNLMASLATVGGGLLSIAVIGVGSYASGSYVGTQATAYCKTQTERPPVKRDRPAHYLCR